MSEIFNIPVLPRYLPTISGNGTDRTMLLKTARGNGVMVSFDVGKGCRMKEGKGGKCRDGRCDEY